MFWLLSMCSLRNQNFPYKPTDVTTVQSAPIARSQVLVNSFEEVPLAICNFLLAWLRCTAAVVWPTALGNFHKNLLTQPWDQVFLASRVHNFVAHLFHHFQVQISLHRDDGARAFGAELPVIISDNCLKSIHSIYLSVIYRLIQYWNRQDKLFLPWGFLFYVFCKHWQNDAPFLVWTLSAPNSRNQGQAFFAISVHWHYLMRFLGTGQTVEIRPLSEFLIPGIYRIFRASQNANRWLSSKC